MNYSNIIIEYFDNASKYGTIDDINALTATAVGALPNNYFKLWVLIADNIIVDSKYQAYGCPYLIALGEYLGAAIHGVEVQDLLQYDYLALANKLELPQAKYYCAIQVAQAVDKIFFAATQKKTLNK